MKYFKSRCNYKNKRMYFLPNYEKNDLILIFFLDTMVIIRFD